MDLISTAYAASAQANPPSMGEAFLYNAGFIVLVVAMFYLLFIRPQKKRMDAHMEMLNQLKKGDRVVTGGGLIGTVYKLKDEKEVELDLGGGNIVTVLRSTLMDKPSSENADTDKDEQEPAKETAKEEQKSSSKKGSKSGKAKKDQETKAEG